MAWQLLFSCVCVLLCKSFSVIVVLLWGPFGQSNGQGICGHFTGPCRVWMSQTFSPIRFQCTSGDLIHRPGSSDTDKVSHHHVLWLSKALVEYWPFLPVDVWGWDFFPNERGVDGVLGPLQSFVPSAWNLYHGWSGPINDCTSVLAHGWRAFLQASTPVGVVNAWVRWSWNPGIHCS